MSDERHVEVQYRDFDPDAAREFLLEEGERVVGVESGTKFDPTVRVWIEVPYYIAVRRRRENDAVQGS